MHICGIFHYEVRRADGLGPSPLNSNPRTPQEQDQHLGQMYFQTPPNLLVTSVVAVTKSLSPVPKTQELVYHSEQKSLTERTAAGKGPQVVAASQDEEIQTKVRCMKACLPVCSWHRRHICSAQSRQQERRMELEDVAAPGRPGKKNFPAAKKRGRRGWGRKWDNTGTGCILCSEEANLTNPNNNKVKLFIYLFWIGGPHLAALKGYP